MGEVPTYLGKGVETACMSQMAVPRIEIMFEMLRLVAQILCYQLLTAVLLSQHWNPVTGLTVDI